MGDVGLNVDTIKVERVDPIIYLLIVNKYATLKEIRDDYSIKEVLDLYETCLVSLYNKKQTYDSVEQLRRSRK